MSNFSFFDSVFKRLDLQTHKNQGLFRKGSMSRKSNQQPVGYKACILTLLQYGKILDSTKLKVFADDKSNVTKMMISIFGKMENQHFLLLSSLLIVSDMKVVITELWCMFMCLSVQTSVWICLDYKFYIYGLISK